MMQRPWAPISAAASTRSRVGLLSSDLGAIRQNGIHSILPNQSPGNDPIDPNCRFR